MRQVIPLPPQLLQLVALLGRVCREEIARDLDFPLAPTPAPFALSFRVGEEAPNGGRFLAVGRRALAVGEALPTLPLALTVHQSVPVELEQTYSRAADSAYLS
jgi:hypothetical protein